MAKRKSNPDQPLLGANPRTAAMLSVLAGEGVTLATYALEVRAIAAAAAEQGDFSAAMKGYELIGKALGAFAPEQHLHLHQGAKDADFAVLSDAQLRSMIQERNAEALPTPDFAASLPYTPADTSPEARTRAYEKFAEVLV